MRLVQSPAPSASLLRHSGDDVLFTLRVEDAPPGRAVLRTSLGGARRRRRELIEAMDADRPPLALDWNDVPMDRLPDDAGAQVFAVRLPLVDVGSFRAKACFFPEGSDRPFWPEGDDVRVKVAPAWTVRWCSLYCAFPRQFGPDCAADRAAPAPEAVADLDARGWSVIPKGGTLRDLIAKLDTILLDERFRIVQLLPVHPVPTTFARMGRFGSPFASTDFLSVNPALAQFDPAATPLDQFRELADAVHTRGGRLFIDLPANHTGWASALQTHHPEWFRREPDGRFHSPGAWGTVWEDLVELDHARPGLRAFLASVFEFWCAQGVDGFRCDAGYMVPAETWRYVVARVRESFPDTVFLLEGLGGKISVTRELIAEEGLDWAYSELFQTEDRAAFERYLPAAEEMSASVGPLAHYAETHDNNRLAARSPAYARMRTALAALASRQGCFGITNGVEWFASEKVDVHGASALRWGAPDNQLPALRRLNTILAALPAFSAGASLQMVQHGDGNSLALLRQAPARPSAPPTIQPSNHQTIKPSDHQTILVLANLDPDRPQPVSWSGFDPAGAVVLFDSTTPDGAPPSAPPDGAAAGLSSPFSLLPDGSAVGFLSGCEPGSARLAPGQVLCLTHDPDAPVLVDRLLREPHERFQPSAVRRQELRMAALRLRRVLTGGRPLGLDEDVEALADLLARDPDAAVARFLPPGAMPPVTNCSLPEDERRIVPLPFGNFLLVRAPHPFRARLEYELPDRPVRKSVVSFQLDDGTHAAFIDHPAVPSVPQGRSFARGFGPGVPLPARLLAELATPGRPTRAAVALQVLPDALSAPLPAPRRAFTGAEVRRDDFVALLTNGRGAMSRVRARWGEVRSQYDALLAANPDPDVPCDRQVLLTRCRAWVVNQGFSSPVDVSCLASFEALPDRAVWRFDVPAGTGRTVPLRLTLSLEPGADHARLLFERPPASAPGHRELDDAEPVRLILRPDVESRSFHEKTKAFAGPERDFPPALRPEPSAFLFAPPGRTPLRVRLSAPDSRFVPEPEWHYMVPNPVEAERGLDGSDDLWSPGWFSASLTGGASGILEASVPGPHATIQTIQPSQPSKPSQPSDAPLSSALSSAFRAYLARRDDAPTVIAGYPWFLDWGRDTFIALRGAIADGLRDLALAVLRKFAAFEDRGTLPNMIHGADASNRDTSDAPLWFCVVVDDLLGKSPTFERSNVQTFKRSSRGKSADTEPSDLRTLELSNLSKVCLRILRGYLSGTPNGIRVDPDSCLVFSPPHFTWMDTNHPAGTPREGYPVEIQALWLRALALAETIEPSGPWSELRARAQSSFLRFFWAPERGFLSDCLHAPAPGTPWPSAPSSPPARRGPDLSGPPPAAACAPDDHLRCNQLFAVTLGAIPPDHPAARAVVASSERLLVSGAIRTLAPGRVRYELPIDGPSGRLNDPAHPYWGRYEGDEDTRRKPAYHNGTAWPWPYPSYAEALLLVHGPSARPAAASLIAAAVPLLETGCIGHLPEIMDGDAPHAPRGCDAQAWSVSEFLRLARLLGI